MDLVNNTRIWCDFVWYQQKLGYCLSKTSYKKRKILKKQKIIKLNIKFLNVKNLNLFNYDIYRKKLGNELLSTHIRLIEFQTQTRANYKNLL